MIKEIIVLLVYLTTDFVNYILCYRVLFEQTLTNNKYKWLSCITGIIATHLILAQFIGYDASYNIGIVTLVIIPILLVKQKSIKKYILYPVVVFGTSTFIISATYLAAILMNVSESEVLDNESIIIACQCVPMIIFTCLMLYRKVKKMDSYNIILDKKQYILFYTVCICIFFMLGPLQDMSGRYVDKDLNFIATAISVSCMIMIIVTLWHVFVVSREQQMKYQNEINSQFINFQKQYYDQLINRDEELRKFRHDFNFHIQTMKIYCEKGDYDSLHEYMKSVVETSAINTIKEYTQNRDIDAILRPFVVDAELKGINISIEGKIKNKIKVTPFDLCTIISNLLKNAIDACEQIENKDNRIIKIEFAGYSSVFNMHIYNTYNPLNDFLRINGFTTKEDKVNHGIGISNVKRTVYKYDGQIEFSLADNLFSVEVTI